MSTSGKRTLDPVNRKTLTHPEWDEVSPGQLAKWLKEPTFQHYGLGSERKSLRIANGGKWRAVLACAAWVWGIAAGAGSDLEHPQELRLGFFPNITHAQALYARATGSFEQAIGAPIRWTAFNDGPTAMEALLADQLDGTFIGPNPAITAYIRSHGEKFVIVAGAAAGGAALVVRTNSGIASNKDFGGKTIATPQLGNTQDISARIWLLKNGYRTVAEGGAVNLVNLSNPDQLTLFRKGQIDGAWTVEPWVSRLQLQAGGRIFLDEKQLWPDGHYVTTQLILTRSFLKQHPQEARNLLRADVEATEWITNHLELAATMLNEQIRHETSRALPKDVIRHALRHVDFTWDPIASSLYQDAEFAYQIHFLRQPPDLAGIYDLTLLNEVLKSKGIPPVHEERK